MSRLYIVLLSLVAWSNALCGLDGVDEKDQHSHASDSHCSQVNHTTKAKLVATEEGWSLPVDPFVASKGGWYATQKTQEDLASLVRNKDPVAAYYLSNVFSNLGDDDDSEKCAFIAKQGFLDIIHDPTASSFRKALAFWYLSLLNNPEGSRIEARKALQEMQESQKSTLFLLWDAYLALMNKEYVASIDSLRQAEEEYPRAFLYEADIYIRQGNYLDAIEPCLQALRRNISEAYAVLYEITTYDKRIFITIAGKLKENSFGEFNSPTNLLERANTARAYEKLALIALQKSNFALAARNYVKSAEAGLPHYFQNASDLYRTLGDTDLASGYEKFIGPFSGRFKIEPYIRQLAERAFEPS